MLKTTVGLSLAALSTLVFATAATAQNVDAIQMEHQRLTTWFNQCDAQMNTHFQRLRILAPQGIMEPMPACSAFREQVVTRLWQLDIAFARTKGDTRHPCQIRYMRGCENYQG